MKYTNMEPIELLNAALKGDGNAFTALAAMYNTSLRKYVWMEGGSILSKEDIEHIVSDTWAAVYENTVARDSKNPYDPSRSAFYTYITGIAKYKVLNRMK
ncbi:MAG: RNA polymerase sigma factor [Bacillota bacterium]